MVGPRAMGGKFQSKKIELLVSLDFPIKSGFYEDATKAEHEAAGTYLKDVDKACTYIETAHGWSPCSKRLDEAPCQLSESLLL